MAVFRARKPQDGRNPTTSPRRSKYGNRRVSVDGLRFDSQAEARRYEDLRLMEAAGEIARLQVHPRFPLRVGTVLVGTYVADFAYLDRQGLPVVEDVKGVRTAVYRLKRKLMQALHGIDIVEIPVR